MIERKPVWILTQDRKIIDGFDLVMEGKRVGLLKEENSSRIFFDITDAKAKDIDFEILVPYVMR